MKILLFVFLSLALFSPAFVWSQQPNRMNDDQVKKLWEGVEKGAGKFRDAVGSKILKVTNAEGQSVDVQQTLKDFDSSSEKLKDAFESHKENMTDVEAFLRQAANIDSWMKNNPNLTNGNSEWQALHQNLDQIVQAYHVSWDWTSNSAHPSRMNDKEIAGMATRIKNASDQVRDDVNDSLKKDSTVDKKARENVENTFKTLGKQAEKLKDRLDDNEPVSAEVGQLLATGNNLKTLLGSAKLNNKASSGWINLQGLFTSLAREYGIPAADQGK